MRKLLAGSLVVLAAFVLAPLIRAESVSKVSLQSPTPVFEYRLLATKKTSTLEEELNEAADAGFRFQGVMGGDTSWGGSEVVAVLSRSDGGEPGRYQYKLLAANRTGTMQNEAQEAADAGYTYVGQTVFTSTFGGREIVLIVERDVEFEPVRYEIKLLATSRTGTMQEELLEAGAAGFEFVGLTVASTTFGGSELVSIMARRLPQ